MEIDKPSFVSMELFEKGPIVVFVWKNQAGWPVETLTQNIFDIYGYTPKQYIDGELQYINQIHPDDLERVAKEVESASKNPLLNSFVHQPYRYKDSFGRYHWVKDSSQIIRSEDGNITHYIGYLIDITEEIELQEETKHLKERLDLAWTGINDGLWDWDIEHDSVYFSPRWKEMIGYAPDEFPDDAKAFFDAIHPDDKAHVEDILQQHFTDPLHALFETDIRLLCKDGNYKWIRTRGRTTLSTDGTPSRMVGAHTDIDQYKKQSDFIELMQRRYSSMFQKHTSIMLLIDPTDSVIIDANESAQAFYGYTRDELLKLKTTDINQLDPQEAANYQQEALTNQNNYFIFSHRLKNGDVRLVEVFGSPIETESGILIYEIIRDITDQKILEENFNEKKQELHKTQIKFQTLFEESLDSIVLINPATQRFIEFNHHACEMYGYTKEEFATLTPKDLDAIHNKEKIIETQQAIMEKGWDQFTTKHKTKDGKIKDIVVSVKVFEIENHKFLHATFHDITEITLQAEIIKKQHEEFKTIFDISRDGLAILDFESNFLDFNDAYLSMTGFTREELLASSCIALSIPEDQERSKKAIKVVIETGYLESFEKTCIIKNGKHITIRMSLSLMPDRKRILISTTDITDIRDHEHQLEFIAHFDTLTKLPNRTLLADRMKQSLATAHRNNQRIAISYLDLDGFKNVNDTLGHDAGDLLLIEASKRMQNALREGDTIARLGGDEFVIILNNQNDNDDTLSTLNRLLHAASAPFEIKNTNVTVSASIGVTFYTQEQNIDADILLRQADQAMYEAKLRGKNQIVIFNDISDPTSQMSENALNIKNALLNNEFMLHYQPKVNMKNGEVIGVEALIRWNDPSRGIVYPDSFLPIVDNRPLMLHIDKWVLNEALSQLCVWHNKGLDMQVSINISAYTLKQTNFLELIDEALVAYPNINPQQIDIEILESNALHEVDEVKQIIEELHKRNITISLDDFGTGYSTLAYLKKLGIDTLKIDKSFVIDILHDMGNLSIIDASVGLAEAFKVKPLAEGVESVEHGQVLIELGCELAQGYIISRPMAPEFLPTWIKEWKAPTAWIETKASF